MPTNTCQNCGTRFEAAHHNTTYCSATCRAEACHPSRKTDRGPRVGQLARRRVYDAHGRLMPEHLGLILQLDQRGYVIASAADPGDGAPIPLPEAWTEVTPGSRFAGWRIESDAEADARAPRDVTREDDF